MNKGDVVVCIDDSIKESSDYFNATIGSRYILDTVNKVYSPDDTGRFSIVNIWIIDDSGDIACYNPKRFVELSLYRENIINGILM